MLFTDKNISDFQNIYKEAFGEEISIEDAIEQGARLVELIKAIYHPITKEDYEKYNEELHDE